MPHRSGQRLPSSSVVGAAVTKKEEEDGEEEIVEEDEENTVMIITTITQTVHGIGIVRIHDAVSLCLFNDALTLWDVRYMSLPPFS